MNISTDSKGRLKQEIQDLARRYWTLVRFLENNEGKELDEERMSLLEAQRKLMWEYLKVLMDRAKLEDIDLHN
ncbi:crAss001_48 related protein [Ileibacterium valens]|uniref:crAss001_48 related protein n=1 Tax=Ileibacterium valens TaxID=1862668 RepID=UPI0027318968|nr:hypothetical protein [Ileibacterium valens]